MKFFDKILEEPSYCWSEKDGSLITPTVKQLFCETFRRINIFKSRKNWASLINWLITICMMPFFILFVLKYFSITRFILFVLYSMIAMGTHATIWLHRYCTHKAFAFSHPVWRIIIQNLVIKTCPEEIYVVSHHVHHAKPDMPGDPYNSKCGLMYCMLAGVNHQPISKNLTRQEYNKVVKFLKHTGIRVNSYQAYNKWGSATSIVYVFALWLLNWAVWYSILYFIGGHGLSCTLFSAAMFWFVLVPAFNYTGHGNGNSRHVDGIDFDRRSLAINQVRPGLLCGEWHNNHHLYPGSARCDFLNSQIDISWILIYTMFKLRIVSSYRDNKKDFKRKYMQEQAN